VKHIQLSGRSLSPRNALDSMLIAILHSFLFFNILVLARVRVTLTDTVIRLEHLINNGDNGVALEIRIKK
jgi:hypothetical protein